MHWNEMCLFIVQLGFDTIVRQIYSIHNNGVVKVSVFEKNICGLIFI